MLPGYTVAGKTGTASMLVGGRYSDTDYHASFVGFLPSRQPALAIIVLIDAPHAGRHYGGDVAAPIFKKIAEAAVRHLGIAPTINPAAPVMVRVDAEPRRRVPAGADQRRQPADRRRDRAAHGARRARPRGARGRPPARQARPRRPGHRDGHRHRPGSRRRFGDRAGPRLPPLAGPRHPHAASHVAAMTLRELLTVLGESGADQRRRARFGPRTAGDAASRTTRGPRRPDRCSSRCGARRPTGRASRGRRWRKARSRSSPPSRRLRR